MRNYLNRDLITLGNKVSRLEEQISQRQYGEYLAEKYKIKRRVLSNEEKDCN
ncbi:hypothetical protein [Butyrivibrio hungatei]|uniref:hypothetical protein n=1 Tax=Butyrivibrio hungatei TaxID=185008 RepID=UPI001372BE36|nr:hypothetical protein [Butyrivibrio hungatei]